MSEERLVFPFTIGDNLITTMSVFQDFCVEYRKLVENYEARGVYIETLEACAKQLTGDEVEYLKPVNYGQGQSTTETYKQLQAKAGEEVTE